MTDIVNFQLADAATYSETGGTAVNIAAWQVDWEDLTAAGFANGDDVIVIARFWQSCASSAESAEAEFRIGTSTFDLATNQETFVTQGENGSPGLGGREQGYIDRITLATDQNFFWTQRELDTSTSFMSDFTIIFIKLNDLTENTDYFYSDDNSYSGDAPAFPATTAESFTLPAGGGDDWLLIGNLHWLVDATTAKSTGRLNQNASGTIVSKFRGRNVVEKVGQILIGYVDNAAASEVELLEYWDDGSNDLERSAFFALRLQVFASSIGEFDTTAVTRDGTLDTFKETHSVVLNLTTTGDVAWFSQTVADVTTVNQLPYHKVELDGTQLLTDQGRQGNRAVNADEEIPLTTFGVAQSVTSGATKTFKTWCAEDNSVSFSYDFDRHTLVAFSMELAGAGGSPLVLYTVPGLSVTNP